MGTYLPLSSLRLVVPPLRLMSAFMWQVIQRRNITHYGKLEQFVRLVSDTVPELMSASQTTKLIIGLRKRAILELCREDAPFNSVIIEAHLETLRKLVSKDEESVTHSNFMKLVRKMLANPAKRDDFFKGTFSVEYGASFDEALQELAWEFLIRIEELLLVPSLKETASWLYDATSAVEDIVQPLSDPADLKDLLQHFKSVRLSHQSALISFVDATGQTFLISQSEPNQAITNIISSVANDAEDVETLIDNVEYTIVNTETAEDQAWENAGCDEQQTLVLDQGHLSTGITEEGAPDLQNDTGDITQFPVNQQPRSLVSGVVTSGPPPSQLDGTPPLAAVVHTEEPPVRQVNLQQWISEIAGTIVSLPVLPPVPENGTGRKVYAGDMILGENVEISADATPEGPKKALIRRKSNSKHTQEILTGNAVLAEAEAIQAIQGKHTCPECGKEFRYGCLLKDHLRTHTGEKPFQCSDCGKSFRCLNLLTNHLKIHSAGKPFKCTECEKAFHKRPDLVKHLRVHTGEKPYKCNICGKSFTQGTYLKIHRECHTSQSLHRCPHCEKTYPTAFKLAVHVRYHTMERAYQCHLCGRSFVYGSLLRRHMGYHVSERQFLCAICGKAFVYLFDLKKHQRNHEKPRPRVSCSLCPKTFAGNEMLRNHMRIHTGERPYQCKECGRSFSQIGNMKRHQRVHTGERPFTCEQCGKTYKHSSHLKDHMLTHTGERPWQCEQCGKSFKSAERRKKHEATHSAERQKSYENSRGRKKQDAKNC